MGQICGECGTKNVDGAERCSQCGAVLSIDEAADVEIEVYDVTSLVEDKPGYFEETLAATRENVRKGSPGPRLAPSVDPLMEEELEPGYEIRQRRVGHKRPRSRNAIIITLVAVALVVAVVYGVRWAVGRMPKYTYTEPAHVAPTDLALEVASELEASRVDLSAGASGATAVLSVGGGGGKVFVDGNYVGDAPATGIRVPPGRRHVIVKQGNAITLDETIDFRARERYSLEPTGAAALAGPR